MRLWRYLMALLSCVNFRANARRMPALLQHSREMAQISSRLTTSSRDSGNYNCNVDRLQMLTALLLAPGLRVSLPVRRIKIGRAQNIGTTRDISPHNGYLVMSSELERRFDITQATKENTDAEEIANFIGKHFYGDLNGFQFYMMKKQRLEELQETLNGTEPDSLFIAREGDEMVGVVSLDSCVRRGKKIVRASGRGATANVVPCISNLVVRKDRRGEGFARQMIAAIEEQVKAWGYNEMYLLVDATNDPAIRLYETSGYIIITSEVFNVLRPAGFLVATKDVNVYHMVKQLLPGSDSLDAASTSEEEEDEDEDLVKSNEDIDT